MTLDSAIHRPRLPLLAILAVSAAMLSAAYAFQYIGGLAPCVLCVYQRVPYAVTIALTVLAVPFAPILGPRLIALGIAACGLAFTGGAAVAGFHVGVEQGWWEGLSSCGSHIDPNQSFEDFKAQLLAAPTVRCTDIAWSLFGISMAGYNLLASAVFAVASFTVARTLLRHGRA